MSLEILRCHLADFYTLNALVGATNIVKYQRAIVKIYHTELLTVAIDTLQI